MDALIWLFGGEPPLAVHQECARAVLVLFYGLVLVRTAGRRAFAKWSALDIIVSIIVGSSLSRALTGSAPLVGTLVATALLMVVHWALAQAAARWPSASRLLEGRPIVLGEAGDLDQSALRRHAISQSDLNESLRQSGVNHAGKAARITLEPSGRITILKEGAG
jgi:uncharacterized membrane protein YcaP (DUF421 family)